MNPEPPAPPIQHTCIPPAALDTIAQNHVLGLHCIGTGADAGGHGADLPTQRIPMPILGDGGALLYELWRADRPCRGERCGDIVLRATDGMLFGVLEIDEAAGATAAGESALCAAAERAYRQIFALLEAQGYGHLWRTWHYLPRIHAEECGLERYRQFNIGRHRAFEACGRRLDHSPAASALGVDGGPFSIAFLAGRAPATPVENPRQTSAFAYPRQYGPRSPTFSRAVTVANGAAETLFISGTASIVGYETVHGGDVGAQTRETVANLSALLAQANARAPSPLYALENLVYRVYIRHADDYAEVRRVLDTSIGASICATYVQADICRRDLLLEIEAFAVAPRRVR